VLGRSCRKPRFVGISTKQKSQPIEDWLRARIEHWKAFVQNFLEVQVMGSARFTVSRVNLELSQFRRRSFAQSSQCSDLFEMLVR
jgi:hypothetical protein